MAKNLNGEGTIRQRPDGLWEGRYHTTTTGGRRVRQSVYAKTAEEVRRKLTDKVAQRDEGVRQPEDRQGPGMTVAELVRGHIDRKAEALSVAPSTWQNLDVYVRRYVEAPDVPLGRVRLRDLTEEDVERAYGRMRRKGYSANTIKTLHSILAGAFRYAAHPRRRWLAYNPMELIERKPARAAVGVALAPAQVVQVLDAAGRHRNGVAVVLAVLTGMRPGELAALRWDRVDFDGGAIAVAQAQAVIRKRHVERFGLTSNVYVKDPKTAAGTRWIEMTSHVRAALLAHREQQRAMGRDVERGRVFLGLTGQPVRTKQLWETWQAIMADLGWTSRIRPYDLRHTAATLEEGAGAPKTTQGRMGHASGAMTMHYTHPHSQRAVTEHVERVLAEARAAAVG